MMWPYLPHTIANLSVVQDTCQPSAHPAAPASSEAAHAVPGGRIRGKAEAGAAGVSSGYPSLSRTPPLQHDLELPRSS